MAFFSSLPSPALGKIQLLCVLFEVSFLRDTLKKSRCCKERLLLLLLRLCLSIARPEFVRQNKNTHMFLVEAECAAFHSPSDTALGGS